MKKQSKFDLTKFHWRHDEVLLRAIREESDSELIKPEQYDEKPEFGEVVCVGESVTDLKVGQIVFFGKYSSEQTRNLSKDYFIVREEDIKADDRNTDTPRKSARTKSTQ